MYNPTVVLAERYGIISLLLFVFLFFLCRCLISKVVIKPLPFSLRVKIFLSYQQQLCCSLVSSVCKGIEYRSCFSL